MCSFVYSTSTHCPPPPPFRYLYSPPAISILAGTRGWKEPNVCGHTEDGDDTASAPSEGTVVQASSAAEGGAAEAGAATATDTGVVCGSIRVSVLF